MERFTDSTDRRPVEFFLFALAFSGFGLGALGIVLTIPVIGVLGTVILLLAVSSFREPEF